MQPKALANRILLVPLPRDHKEGSIHLPENRNHGGRSKGECILARVVSVGSEVREEIKRGVILFLDPSALDDCWFEMDGKEYLSVPDEPFSWRDAKGYFFGITKHGKSK